MIRDRLQQRNQDLLRDIEVMISAVIDAAIPDALQPYRAQLLVVCEKLRDLAEKNLRYLQVEQADILDDVLSNTQYLKRRCEFLSTSLVTPLVRAADEDRASLAIIAWQHQAHPQTVRFPAAFCDGAWAIWPLVEMAMPLYYIPSIHQRGLRFLALLFHEFGHLLYRCHKQELDDLVAELQEYVADMLRPLSHRNDRYAKNQARQRQAIVETWYAWAQELFCDAVGFTIGGPCYVYAFSHYVNMLHADDFAQQPQDMAASRHPVTWLRIRFLVDRATAAGFTTLGTETDREWRDFARVMDVNEDYHGFYHERLYKRIMHTIEDMLVETAPQQYNPEEVDVSAWYPDTDSPIRLLNWAWRQYLVDPEHYASWEAEQIKRFVSTAVAVP